MSDSQQLATPFPGPPSFYHSFTKENTERLHELDAQAAESGSASTVHLPEELRNLRPPTPPLTSEYYLFGEKHSLEFWVPPIPADERVLPPPSDPSQRIPSPSQQALLTVTRSILLSYLELLHLLIANPAGTEYGPKWEDLRDLFRNAHSLLNSYREWQSREALIDLMQEQVDRGVQAKDQWDSLEKKVDELLQSIAAEASGEEVVKAEELLTDGGAGSTTKAGEMRRMWELVEDDMDE